MVGQKLIDMPIETLYEHMKKCIGCRRRHALVRKLVAKSLECIGR